jgi:hypothetical protein
VFDRLIAAGQVLKRGQEVGMVGFEAVAGGTSRALGGAVTR